MPDNRTIPSKVTTYPCGAAAHWDSDLVHQRTRVQEAVICSYQQSALSAADYCREAIQIAKSSDEDYRRKMAYRRRMMLYDAWKTLLFADIKIRLTQDSLWKAIAGPNGEFADITRNSAKMIWEEMSQLYKSPATRSTPGDNNKSADKYVKLMRWSLFHLFWQSVELHLMAFNDLIIWPSVEERMGKETIAHNMAAGDTVTVIRDAELTGRDPTVLVFFNHAACGESKLSYTVWTPWFHGVFADDKDCTQLDAETLQPTTQTGIDDDGEECEYIEPNDGWPFVFIHKDPYHPWFWDQTGGDDLVELNLKLGRRGTNDDYLWDRSSFKQLAIFGQLQTGAEQNLMDVSAILKFIGEDLTAQLIDWQVDFQQRQDVTNGEEMRGAASRGINPERMRRTSYQDPGAARQAAGSLSERRERLEPVFGRAEFEYYWQTARLAKQENLEHKPDQEMELETVHAPIEFPGEPDKQIAIDESLERRAVQSQLDVVLRDHPSWTRDEAFEYIKKNAEDLARISAIKQAAGVPENDLANRSAADEINGAKGPAVRDAKTPPSSPDDKPALGE